MTDSVDVGLRFIVEPSGVELSSEEADLLSDLRPAGIMLRKRNLMQGVEYGVWLAAYSKLLSDIRAAIGRSSIVVCVDHEGGNVNRFPAPITRFPYPAAYASREDAIREVTSMMARELRSLGVNLSFSPVADIHSNPANPVINERAFGTTAEEVAKRSVVCAEELRRGGVVPCAKHFPGHGDTSVDSHLALPVVNRTEEELERRELVPFRELISHGIEMIMSGHLMLPHLDAANPATLSTVIMGGLLRGKLGFAGITIADALGMKAICNDVRACSFATRAHQAGIDLFLMVGDTVSLRDAIAVRDELRAATSDGRCDVASMVAVNERLTRFLTNLPQYSVSELDSAILARHASVAKDLAANAPWSDFQFNPVGFD